MPHWGKGLMFVGFTLLALYSGWTLVSLHIPIMLGWVQASEPNPDVPGQIRSVRVTQDQFASNIGGLVSFSFGAVLLWRWMHSDENFWSFFIRREPRDTAFE
jgi:hypothetical protein